MTPEEIEPSWLECLADLIVAVRDKARTQTLEEAAKIVENYDPPAGKTYMGLPSIAAAIRALEHKESGEPVKIYTIRVVIQEGQDEFWESLAGKSGCNEVVQAVRQALFEHGFQEGYGTQVELQSFEISHQDERKQNEPL